MWTVAPHTDTQSREWSDEVRHAITAIPLRSPLQSIKLTFLLDQHHSTSSSTLLRFLTWWNTTDGGAKLLRARVEIPCEDCWLIALRTRLEGKFTYLFFLAQLRYVVEAGGVFWMEWLGSFKGRNKKLLHGMGVLPENEVKECLNGHFQKWFYLAPWRHPWYKRKAARNNISTSTNTVEIYKN